MPTEDFSKQSDNLIEYRITKLEEGINSLNILKDIVIKWDTKFASNEGFLQCPVHKVKMEDFEKRLIVVEEVVTDLDRFKWKAVGVLAGVLLIVQLFGTTVIDKYIPQDPVRVEWVMPTGMTNVLPSISHPR